MRTLRNDILSILPILSLFYCALSNIRLGTHMAILLLGIRFDGRWSRQASGRLIKVKYIGNRLGGEFEMVVQGKWSFKKSGR